MRINKQVVKKKNHDAVDSFYEATQKPCVVNKLAAEARRKTLVQNINLFICTLVKKYVHTLC